MSRSPRSKPRLASVALAVVAATALLAAGSLPAHAADGATAANTAAGSSGSAAIGVPSADPVAVLERLAPDLLAQTVEPATTADATDPAPAGPAPFTARIPADATQPIRLTPADTEGAGQPVSITIADARGQARTTDGIRSYATRAPAANALVQPILNGVRLLTTLADASAGEEFSYRFDLPEGSGRVDLPGGQTLVTDRDHRYIGTLEAPWALDANGAEVPTRYSWSGDTLTQHVDLSEQTAFPVLLDPMWLYSYDFSAALPLYHAVHPKASERAVDRLLHGCFNCYFPINGGPRSYPADGDILALNASPFSLITVPAPVKVQTANGGALQFVAQAGHFDGAGSMVTFAWYNDPSGYLHLYVHAMIMVDRGPAANIANSRIAGANWLLYWQRVADHADGSSGGGGV